jgi:hypothetical protein
MPMLRELVSAHFAVTGLGSAAFRPISGPESSECDLPFEPDNSPVGHFMPFAAQLLVGFPRRNLRIPGVHILARFDDFQRLPRGPMGAPALLCDAPMVLPRAFQFFVSLQFLI